MRAAATTAIGAVIVAGLILAGCGGGGGGAGGQTREAADALPIRDDFEGECTWPEEDDETDRLACEDGHYVVVFKDVDASIAHFVPRRTKAGYTAVGVEATSTLVTAPGPDQSALQAVGCWASARGDPNYGYVFGLATLGDGEQGYLIAKQDEERVRSGLGLEPLVEEEAATTYPAGSPVTIRGECRLEANGIRLVLYVDGERVAAAEDAGGAEDISAFGAYGFFPVATRRGTEIVYDDFLAAELTD